jgi:nitrite reductase/ring-hydroxylating ferredoxin subunit
VTSPLVLCDVHDVAEGTALEVEAGDLLLAVFNVDGTFHVTDNNCTHGPGLLSEGNLDGTVVECDFHGGQFDIRTGAVVGPPCVVPVKTYPTVIDGGKVVIYTE